MKTLIVLISIITEILSMISTHRVDVSYSCEINVSETTVSVEGHITAQQNYYYVSGNGLDIYCDGQSRWTVDREAREVYIEQACGLEEFISDPDSYLGALSDLKIKDVKYSSLEDGASIFRFDTKSLDNSWVVTDLR